MSDIFEYKSFLFEDSRHRLVLNYKTTRDAREYELQEVFTFSTSLPDCYEVNQLARALHLACGISYYKTFMPSVIVQPYQFSQAEADFWNEVFRGGLGEFLYINKLNPAGLAKFNPQPGISYETNEPLDLNQTALLGIGGGKDSIVAGELLKSLDQVGLSGFVLSSGDAVGQSQAVAETMGVDLLVISRQLDKKLIELQKSPGAYSGHIPISLIFALTGCLLAVAQNSRYVIVANEASSSLPTAQWAGSPVNHQWSKSESFEKSLQDYLHENVSVSLDYFSAIRPLGSVAVAKIFAKIASKYFEKFTSDNYVFRVDPSKRPNSRWSLESPKTLSSFILLAPWLNQDEMLKIFGRNMLNEPTLSKLFLELLGLVGEPPLDCVGTPSELQASLTEVINQKKWLGSALLNLPELSNLNSQNLEAMSKTLGIEHFPESYQLKAKLNAKIMELI